MAENIETNVTSAEPVANILAKITMNDAGEFFVESVGEFLGKDGKQVEISGPLKFSDEGDKTIVLTANAANRWWANRAKVTEACKTVGFYGLTYKETKKIGPIGTKLPNEKLISYLSADEQAEYKAIIDRAIAAKNDAASKPMTDLEKAQAARDKAEKKYQELLAAAAGTTPKSE